MKTLKPFVTICVMAIAIILLGTGCNPILNLIGLGSVVLEDFELEAPEAWEIQVDGQGSALATQRTSESASGGDFSTKATYDIADGDPAVFWGAFMKRTLSDGPQDWEKLSAVSFQMNPNGSTGTLVVELLDSDGTALQTGQVVSEATNFSGSGWDEYYFDFSDFGTASWAPGDIPGFDWASVAKLSIQFVDGTGTVYIDDIVAEWSLFK